MSVEATDLTRTVSAMRPVIPARDFDVSKRFYVDGRVQYFKLSVDHLTGTVEYYEFSALYRYRPNISFALGYTSAKADIDSRQTKTSGYFDLNSKGPEAFIRVAF